MIYLAVPYTHKDKAVRAIRFERVTTLAGRMLAQGLHVYSPITHGHPMAERVDIPTDWEFWREYDFKFLAICKELHVYMLDGWDVSPGVTAEIAHAKGLGMPITFVAKEF
jgi:hypothetical protein